METSVTSAVTLLTTQEREQAQIVYNSLYNLLLAIKDTQEVIAEAFDNPIGFFVGKIRDAVVFGKECVLEEAENACKEVMEDAKERMETMEKFITNLGKKFPKVEGFITKRFSKLGQNTLKLEKMVKSAEAVIKFVAVVGPYFAAIIASINKILNLFGMNIPLIG